MNELPPLAPLEKVDMPLNFAFRVGMPAFVLWWMLQTAIFETFSRRFFVNAAAYCLLWAYQKRSFRTPDGTSLFMIAFEIAGISGPSPSSLPGYRLLVHLLRLAVPAVVLATVASIGHSFPAAKGVLDVALVLLANLPLLYVLYHTNQLYEGHRIRYHFARDRWRKKYFGKVERERLRQIVAAENPPRSFEARLALLTLKHHERLSELRRLPLSTDERQYLIELETTRFTESVRAMTDPSLQSPSCASYLFSKGADQ
jgi:hypothetical protein